LNSRDIYNPSVIIVIKGKRQDKEKVSKAGLSCLEP